uniref:Uncharacterized protein n=1 Tax=Glossina palpalis gambiensis TaxID=67801 RepID=A0A1B0AQ27_9MUSC
MRADEIRFALRILMATASGLQFLHKSREAPQGMCKLGMWVQKVEKLMLRHIRLKNDINSKKENLENQQREYDPISMLSNKSTHIYNPVRYLLDRFLKRIQFFNSIADKYPKNLQVAPRKCGQEDTAKLPQNLTKMKIKSLRQHKDVYKFKTSCAGGILLLRNGWSIDSKEETLPF